MSLQKVFLILLVLTSLPLATQARDLSDMTIDVLSDKHGAEAKQDAFDRATEQVVEKLTEDLMGAEKAGRYWPGIKAKVLKNSERYLLFIKGSAPQDVNGGTQTKITVTLRISTDNLETFLREEGVLNSGTLRVLPLVEVVDSRGVHYAWWSDAPEATGAPGLEDVFKKFLTRMSSKLKVKNVYMLDPTAQSFRMSVPAAYRSLVLRHEDQMLLAQYLKADVVVSGKIEVARLRSENSELKLAYDLQMWQAKSGRDIADVQRFEPLSSDNPKVVQAVLDQTSSKVLDELAGKLADAESSGNLNLNLIKVAVSGTMNYRQQSEFKRQLAQVREIKVLRERFFEPGRVVFEAESSVNGTELARAIQRTRFSLYNVAVEGSQDDSLALKVKALSSASVQ